MSNQFTASEANKTLRGLIQTLCNAISEFSDSEDAELIDDGRGFKRLCQSVDRVQATANSVPDPDAATPELLAASKAVLSMVESIHEVPPTRFIRLRDAIAKAEGR